MRANAQELNVPLITTLVSEIQSTYDHGTQKGTHTRATIPLSALEHILTLMLSLQHQGSTIGFMHAQAETAFERSMLSIERSAHKQFE